MQCGYWFYPFFFFNYRCHNNSFIKGRKKKSNIQFFFIFDQKMAAILNFEKFFKVVFQKAQLDPREVIVCKFEGPTSNGLVATQGTKKKQTI